MMGRERKGGKEKFGRLEIKIVDNLIIGATKVIHRSEKTKNVKYLKLNLKIDFELNRKQKLHTRRI